MNGKWIKNRNGNPFSANVLFLHPNLHSNIRELRKGATSADFDKS